MSKVFTSFTHSVIVILLALTGAAGAQASTPIGPSSWVKPDGRIQRAMGMGGAPVLNYQKDDGSWDFIVDDWVQVGDQQVWKSVRGNHRVFADSTGAAIYAVGNHYFGTQTPHLVKFNTTTRQWTILREASPDSVRASGREIVFYGIFPGVDKKLVNNAKVFQSYAETFIFKQEARDSLAAWGPWTGYLLGTATRLNVDSLNLTLRDGVGSFGLTTAGRMVDGWVSLGSADTSAFYLGTAHLRTEDSTTNIPVRKFLARRGGSRWLVELFDPIAVGALPAGDISHNLWFGNQTIESEDIDIENAILGGLASPSSDGTLDSVTAYFIFTGEGALKIRGALYLASNLSLVDSCTGEPQVTTNQWLGVPATAGASILAANNYYICVWGQFSGLVAMFVRFTDLRTTDGVVFKALDYSGNGWPSSLTSTFKFDYDMTVYATYTEVSAGRRRQLLLKAGR